MKKKIKIIEYRNNNKRKIAGILLNNMLTEEENMQIISGAAVDSGAVACSWLDCSNVILREMKKIFY